MKITEVRIKLMDDGDDRLQAFCSITLDDAFVVRDLKIIDGSSGPCVAMPSRKLTAHCPNCRYKNHLRAAHCNHCGGRLNEDLAPKDGEGRSKLYADIAHPINSECREMIQRSVIEAFRKEVKLSQQPGYISSYDDYLDYDPVATAPERSTSSAKQEHRRVESSPAQPRGPHFRKESTKDNVALPGDASEDPDAEDGFGAGIF